MTNNFESRDKDEILSQKEYLHLLVKGFNFKKEEGGQISERKKEIEISKKIIPDVSDEINFSSTYSPALKVTSNDIDRIIRQNIKIITKKMQEKDPE